MKIEELDYELPPAAIALRPAEPRDHSRLLVYRRGAEKVEHRRFYELPELLATGDLLLVNDTKVLPAKLRLHKETGGVIPGLFVRELAPGRWEVMLRSRGKVREGMSLLPDGPPTEVQMKVLARGAGKGHWVVAVEPADEARTVLARIGHVPLPPYIEGARTHGGGPQEEPADRASYQTVYAAAEKERSVAAPTAGLHFTPELLTRLHTAGVRTAQVTLHVGLGTFLPVEAATLEEHKMHSEEFVVPAETVAALRAQRARGGRIVVVGTTAVRTLEAAADKILDLRHPPTEIRGTTDLLIKPGYAFRLTDVLVTNFHLPRSTLLALVGAMVGLERLKQLYRVAIGEGYRFYSYGDAMLILP